MHEAGSMPLKPYAMWSGSGGHEPDICMRACGIREDCNRPSGRCTVAVLLHHGAKVVHCWYGGVCREYGGEAGRGYNANQTKNSFVPRILLCQLNSRRLLVHAVLSLKRT